MNSSNDVSSSSFPRRTGVAVNSSPLDVPVVFVVIRIWRFTV
jgi:hypothetical protein